jgi:hypothetical protein
MITWAHLFHMNFLDDIKPHTLWLASIVASDGTLVQLTLVLYDTEWRRKLLIRAMHPLGINSLNIADILELQKTFKVKKKREEICISGN